MEGPIEIFLIDDHRLLSDGLKRLIESGNTYRVSRTFSEGAALLEALHYEQPKILLSDISMPGIDGIALAREVLHRYPAIKFIFLSMHTGPEYVKPAMQTGAHGYLLKDSRIDDIFEALDLVLAGGRYIAPKAATALLSAAPGQVEITPREKQILLRLAQGAGTKQIADQLSISIHTVESHRKNLLAKTNCQNVAGLILWGVTHGYIDSKKQE
jgi:DNA-binding NarL/FixJ family response regulator